MTLCEPHNRRFPDNRATRRHPLLSNHHAARGKEKQGTHYLVRDYNTQHCLVARHSPLLPPAALPDEGTSNLPQQPFVLLSLRLDRSSSSLAASVQFFAVTAFFASADGSRNLSTEVHPERSFRFFSIPPSFARATRRCAARISNVPNKHNFTGQDVATRDLQTSDAQPVHSPLRLGQRSTGCQSFRSLGLAFCRHSEPVTV